MAELDWGGVVTVGLLAFVGFSLLCYWVSAWMARRSISGQVKGKPPKPKEAKAQTPQTAQTAVATPPARATRKA